MFHWLTSVVSGNPITYLVVLGVAAGDVLFPLLPAETVVLTAAVLAADGHLTIWGVIPAAAAGGFLGDNASFFLGATVGERVAALLFRGEKGEARLDWARRAVRSRGPIVIVAGRFLPGGRTGSTFAAGTLRMEWRRFARADAAAAVAWALYVGLLGYLGGAAFQKSLWKPLAIAAGVALAVAGGTEVYRRVLKRRGRELLVAED